MKEFKWTDVRKDEGPCLTLDTNGTDELIFAPLDWQKRGLSQTASGYGNKLVSRYKVRFEGRDYRLYVTCFSNTGSTWFTVRKQRIYVR